MQRWEQRQRQRIHDSKIENVKSTFQRQSKSRQKQALSSSRSKVTVHTTYKPTLPFLRILEIFQLQQYSNLLHFYGFPGKLANKNALVDIEEMLSKVQIDDRERFMSLLNTLAIMSKSINKPQESFKRSSQIKRTQIKRNSILDRSKQSGLPPSSSKISTIQKSQKQGLGIGGGKQTNSKFRIKNAKQTPTIKKSSDSLQRKATQKKKANTPIIKPFIDTKRVYSMMMDDSHITQNYKKNKRGQPAMIENSNTLIKKLFNRLKQDQTHAHLTHKGEKGASQQTIQLQMKKIKEMYLSYDSGTLTSNITNIDIEEIIDCFALQIIDFLKKTQQFMQNKSLVVSNKQEIEQLLKQSFLAVKQQSKDSSKHTNEKIYKHNTQSQVQQEYALQQFDTLQRPKGPIHSQDAESISIEQQNETISRQSDSSDSFRNINYQNSFAADFTCFDSRFEQSIYTHKPTKQDIKNFVQLVMMAGKMEKQIPILAHVYLKRLLKSAKGGHLTYSNWRNIVLIVLIEGSKIWDDQSLENNSFAKVIKPYTTLQINRLQKYLLAFIDYTLKVDQKEYSQSYFQLRRHIGQASKTANLLKLDLKTIKKLQSGAKKNQGKLQYFYQKCMNKSF